MDSGSVGVSSEFQLPSWQMWQRSEYTSGVSPPNLINELPKELRALVFESEARLIAKALEDPLRKVEVANLLRNKSLVGIFSRGEEDPYYPSDGDATLVYLHSSAISSDVTSEMLSVLVRGSRIRYQSDAQLTTRNDVDELSWGHRTAIDVKSLFYVYKARTQLVEGARKATTAALDKIVNLQMSAKEIFFLKMYLVMCVVVMELPAEREEFYREGDLRNPGFVNLLKEDCAKFYHLVKQEIQHLH